MPGKTQADARLTRYLLGVDSEAERERLEAEYFADEDAFEQVLIAEDELVDAYTSGELSAKERRQFEEHFLKSSRGRERVQFARTLADAMGADVRPVARAERDVVSQPGFFASLWAGGAAVRVAFAALAIAVLAGFPPLLVERSRMRNELATLRAEREAMTAKNAELQRAADAERGRSTELTAQVKGLQEQLASESSSGRRGSESGALPREGTNSNQTVARDTSLPPTNNEPTIGTGESVSLTLLPGTRSGQGNTLKLSRKVNSIKLRLGGETQSLDSYEAVIQSANDNRVVWRSRAFKPGATAAEGIELPTIPAASLPAGSYILTLTGKRADGTSQNAGSYSFTVLKN